MKIYEIIQSKINQAKSPFKNGATDKQIDDLEVCLGKALPSSYKEFIREKNGEIEGFGLFLGFRVLDTEEIISELLFSKSVYIESDNTKSSYVNGQIKEDYFNPLWLPIATDDGGNYIAIDFDPGSAGAIGQIISHGRDESILYVLADSFTSWLNFVVSEINNCQIIEANGSIHLSWKDESHLFDCLPDILDDSDTLLSRDLIDETTLEKPWSDFIEKNIGQQNIHKVKELVLLRTGISSLQPVGLFKNCTKLVASGLTIADFPSLLAADWLKVIYLAKTNLENLSCVEGFKQLKVLSIGNTNVTKISELESIPALTDISLENLCISDYSPLFTCKKLQCLTISGSNFFEFDRLVELKNLKELKVSDLKIPNLLFVAKLKKLESIEMTDKDIIDFEPLIGLEKLRYICCPYAIFAKTNKLFSQKIHYAISGGMTAEEERLWHEYSVR